MRPALARVLRFGELVGSWAAVMVATGTFQELLTCMVFAASALYHQQQRRLAAAA